MIFFNEAFRGEAGPADWWAVHIAEARPVALSGGREGCRLWHGPHIAPSRLPSEGKK